MLHRRWHVGPTGARVHDRVDASSGCCTTSSRSATTSNGSRCRRRGSRLVIRDVTMSGVVRRPMSDRDLLVAGRDVVSRAQPSEELEVFVGRSRSTNVKAYDGAVEALSSAQSMGVGIRVIVDGRQGFAYAGTLDDDVIATTLADARDNVRYSERDEFVALARPDGVAPVAQDLWMDEVVDFPERAQDRSGDRARATGARRAIRASPACARRRSPTRRARARSRPRRASPATDGDVLLAVGDRARPARRRDTTVGNGYDLARQAGRARSRRAWPTTRSLRATRLLGAKKPASQRVTVVLEPRLAAIDHGHRRRHAQR